MQGVHRLVAGLAMATAVASSFWAFFRPLDAAVAGTPDGGARTAPTRDPGCIYGKVLDGHTGAIRCLSPAEVTPPGPYDIPPPSDGGADGSAPARRARWRDAGEPDVAIADAAIALRAVSVSVDSVEFENGDVPRAQAVLERFAKKELTRCASDHDWRAGTRRAEGDARIDIRFLVRAPGKAEGIDVSGARGLSTGLIQCITSALANRPMGAPSNDPVAVSVRFRFR